MSHTRDVLQVTDKSLRPSGHQGLSLDLESGLGRTTCAISARVMYLVGWKDQCSTGTLKELSVLPRNQVLEMLMPDEEA